MILKYLQIESFKSFKKSTTFSFERETGLHFLTGRNEVEPDLEGNGAGKSSLLDALVWVLYGKTAQGVKAANVRNWNSMKPCRVKCDFAIDGIGHAIERIWGPNSLKLDGQIVEQDVIDALINLTPEEFNYSIFASQFGQMFFDLSPTEKLTVFTDIMALEAWTERSAKASRKAKALDIEIREGQSRLSMIEGTLDALEAEVVRNQSASKGYEEEKATQLKDLRATYADWCDDYDNLVNEFEELQKQKFIRPDTKPAEDWNSDHHKAIDRLDSVEKTLIRYDVKLMHLQEEWDKFDGVTDKCPHCNQSVSSEHIEKQKDGLEEDISDIHRDQKKSKSSKAKLIKKCESLETKLEDLSTLVLQHSDKAKDHKQKIAAVKDKLSIVNHTITAQDDLIDAAEKRTNPFTKIIGEAKARKMRVTKDRIARKKDIDHLMQELEGMQFWAKGFKEIRLFLVEEALTQLEVEINNNLLQLGLRDWSIKLDVERETATGGVAKGFHVTVQSPYNPKPVPWAVWSGGESQRLRLAGTMGLSDLILARKGIECNIEIYDEPTAHLSQSGIEDLLDSLYHRAIDRQKQIWLVDHRSLDFGSFASTTTIVKDKEGSHIV